VGPHPVGRPNRLGHLTTAAIMLGLASVKAEPELFKYLPVKAGERVLLNVLALHRIKYACRMVQVRSRQLSEHGINKIFPPQPCANWQCP